MKGRVTDLIRINHILKAISEVESYVDGVSYDQFLLDSEKKFATIKQIEIVGEACNHLSSDYKTAHPEIEWKSINGFRNISIHEYFGVDFRIVWEIANDDLPFLKQQFEAL